MMKTETKEKDNRQRRNEIHNLEDLDKTIEILNLEWIENIVELGKPKDYPKEDHKSIATIKLLTVFTCDCDWIVMGDGDPYCNVCRFFVLKLNNRR